MRDHYDTLEVAKDASPEEIQRAYRALAMRFHPDRNPTPEAAARMTLINEAWGILGEPHRRREYDMQRCRPVPNAEIVAAILLAAREVILRAGWRVIEDNGRTLL